MYPYGGGKNVICKEYARKTSLSGIGNHNFTWNNSSFGSGFAWVKDDSYETADAFKTAKAGVYFWFKKSTPITFTSLFLSASSTSDELTQMPADAIPLSEIQFADNNWSIEEAIYDAPEADANGVITPTAVTGQMRIQYSLDAAEQIDTLQKEYQALEARLDYIVAQNSLIDEP